jgi:hypothetical protein
MASGEGVCAAEAQIEKRSRLATINGRLDMASSNDGSRDKIGKWNLADKQTIAFNCASFARTNLAKLPAGIKFVQTRAVRSGREKLLAHIGSSAASVARPSVCSGPAADQGRTQRFANGFGFGGPQSPELIPSPLHVRRSKEKQKNIDGRSTFESAQRPQHARFDCENACQYGSCARVREARRQSDRSAGDDDMCGIGPIKTQADADGTRICRQPPGSRPMGRSVTDNKTHADNRVLTRRLGRPQSVLGRGPASGQVAPDAQQVW